MFWNNFKKSCIRGLKTLPTEPCPLGQTNFNEKNNLQHKDDLCPWYINDKKYNFCFWKYVNEVSDQRGQMPILCYREIAKFLGISSSTVGITVRDCLEKLKEHPDCQDIKDLILEIGNGNDTSDCNNKVINDAEKLDID